MGEAQSHQRLAPRTYHIMGHFTEEGLKQLRKRASKVGQTKPSLCEPLFDTWADLLIGWIPLWVSPCLITLIGVLCLFQAYLGFLVEQNLNRAKQESFDVLAPPIWACLVAAACCAAYATLNTLDEKQGERTGSSSALSDVFNIAADAFAICLITVIISSVTMLGAQETLVLFCIIEFTYFGAHWVHYHCGSAANSSLTIKEGLVAVMAACLACAYNPAVWKYDVGTRLPVGNFAPESFVLNQLLVYALLAYSCYVNTSSAVRVYTRYQNSEGSLFGPALLQLVPAAVSCVCTVWWAQKSPTALFDRHPHWFFLGIGLVLGNLCVRLVTSNMSKQRFSIYPYMVTLLLLCTILSVTGCYGTDQDKNKEEEICLAWFFAMGAWNFYNLTKNICLELSQALDLGIFCLKNTRVA